MGNRIEKLDLPDKADIESLKATKTAMDRSHMFIGLLTIAGMVAAALYSRCNPVSVRAEETNLNPDSVDEIVVSGEDLNRLPEDVISFSMLPETLQPR